MARIFGIVSPRAESLSASMADTIGRGHVGFTPEVVTAVAGVSAVLGVLDRQPHRAIATVDRLAVVVDGAIFNRGELGVFPNDAHLVAELFRAHGFERALTRLNGDFSIALYEGVSSTLWLARDRLGVKPLYYAHTNGELAFASRPWPSDELPGIGREMNRRFAAVFAAAHYRYFDNVPTESPYERVAQLPAAHWLRFDGHDVRIGRYWQFRRARLCGV